MMIKLDASSLIYALKMNFLPKLLRLYESLVITEAVYNEVIIIGLKKGKQEAVIGEQMIKDKEIKLHKIKEKLIELKLGKGETETIQNAIEIQCQCMIDDKKAKKIAETFKLNVKNIPIALLEAFQQNIIDNSEFDDLLLKWVRYASPPYEEIYFVKKVKEMLEE